MNILKFVGGAIAAVCLIKIGFFLLAMVAGVVKLLLGLVFLALAIAMIVFVFKFVFKVINGEHKTA